MKRRYTSFYLTGGNELHWHVPITRKQAIKLWKSFHPRSTARIVRASRG